MKHLIIKNNKGSITLEAAIVLPIYMFAIMTLMSLLQMLNVYMAAERGAYRAGKELALYLPVSKNVDLVDIPVLKELINTAVESRYAKKSIEEEIEKGSAGNRYITGDINMNYSKYKANEIIDIIAVYKLKPDANIFGISKYSMVTRARLHPWIGYDKSHASDDDGEERIVYVTETGTVYHLSKSCTHLDLSIFSAQSNDLTSLRNVNGAKYKKCEVCGGSSEILYLTTQGDRYHSSITCSGLKRTIIAIPISQVGNKGCCSRCGG